MRVRFAVMPMMFLLLSLPAQALTVDCGRLLDVKAGKWREHVSVNVSGTRITSVETQQSGAGGDHVDLRNYSCLPGLIDMHTHLTMQITNAGDTYRDILMLDSAGQAYQSVGYAEKTLQAGFTTVRNLGAEANMDVAMKRAIAQGWIRGPRIFAAGTGIGSTGGHADGTDGFKPEFAGHLGPEDGIVNSPDDARRAVRQHYKDGADVIKIVTTGGVLDLSTSGDNAQMTYDEVRAIVETAKDYGFRVAVHAHGAEGIKRALRAGVDSIEHGTYMDDEAIRLIKQHGAWYVPTLSAGKAVALKAALPGYFAPAVQAKAAAIGPLMQNTLNKAYKAGVKIAFGTDAAVYPHGENAGEFGYMVEAGMPAIEAIRAATTGAAQLLGKPESLGSVEVNYLADMIAVEGDPLADVGVLKNVRFVMKDGVVYKTP